MKRVTFVARTLLVLLLLTWPMVGRAQAEDDPAAEALDGLSGASMKQLVDVIVGAKMQGRRTGQPGGAKIEEWVAQKFAEYGMHPADQAGAYLEPYQFAANRVIAPIALQVGDKAQSYGVDFVHIEESAAGTVTAPLVYCGYGVCRPDLHWNDFAGVDLKGKIAVIRTGRPRDIPPAEGIHGRKVAKAASLGAVGCLFFDERAVEAPRMLSQVGHHEPQTIPALSVSRRLVDALLAAQGSSLEAMQKLEEAANNDEDGGSMRPGTARSLAVDATMKVSTARDPKAMGNNVLARFDGRDPDLKHEVVLFCAPADSLGIAPNGALIDAADQSASPLAVFLHLADLFSLNKYRPKRTIVFCAFTGCAQAAHGADALLARLPFPGKLVATVHCGPVGRRPPGDRPPTVWRYGPSRKSPMGKRIALPSMPKLPAVVEMPGVGDSWNRNRFMANDIPSFWLTTWLKAPYHHTMVDTADRVEAKTMEMAAQVLGRWLVALGSAATPLAENKKVANPGEAPAPAEPK